MSGKKKGFMESLLHPDDEKTEVAQQSTEKADKAKDEPKQKPSDLNPLADHPKFAKFKNQGVK